MRKIYMMVCVAMLLAACGSQQQKKNEEPNNERIRIGDMHNAEISLDYEGTYKGVFPAADCPGIETTLTLNPNKTFTLNSEYIDRNLFFNESGNYTVKGNLLTLITGNGEREYYKVEENRLRKLDMDKKEVTGELAEHYILKKK